MTDLKKPQPLELSDISPHTHVVELEKSERTPYPWCHGSPTKADCVKRGYCNRDPNCGE